jgi:hypothetical protein
LVKVPGESDGRARAGSPPSTASIPAWGMVDPRGMRVFPEQIRHLVELAHATAEV